MVRKNNLCEFPEEFFSYGKDFYYPRNSIICFQNDPPERVFYLKEGRVCLSYYSKKGERKVVTYDEKGSIFGGEIAILLNQSINGVTAVANTNCLVTRFEKDVFKALLLESTDFTRFCLQETAGKVWVMGNQINSLSFLNCDGRIISSLLWLMEHMETNEDLNSKYILKITHQELGELASVNRVIVTNFLNFLETKNLICKRSKTIIIPPEGKEKLRNLIQNGR